MSIDVLAVDNLSKRSLATPINSSDQGRPSQELKRSRFECERYVRAQSKTSRIAPDEGATPVPFKMLEFEWAPGTTQEEIVIENCALGYA